MITAASHQDWRTMRTPRKVGYQLVRFSLLLMQCCPLISIDGRISLPLMQCCPLISMDGPPWTQICQPVAAQCRQAGLQGASAGIP